MKPTWERDGIRLYLADCRDVLPHLSGVDCVVTDPPYGICYSSGMTGHDGGTALPGICGDTDASLRDFVLDWNSGRSAIVFGSWKVQRPSGCRAILTWDKGEHVGMGDLSMPWKPNTEEVYVIGKSFSGHRGSSILRYDAPVTWNSVKFGRQHPHEKPVKLMVELVGKTNGQTILDPFMGSGTTGAACIRLGRKFIGVELDGEHFETAKQRIIDELDRAPLFAEQPQTQIEMFEQ